MEIDYLPVDGKNMKFFAFEAGEKKELIKMCRNRISYCKTAIKRIRNNPKNEGQAHYAAQIEDYHYSIFFSERLIQDLLN